MNYRWQNVELDTSAPEIVKLFHQTGVYLRSNYARIIPAWSQKFGRRFAVFNYDDLVANPRAFVAEVFHFIGADPSWQPPNLRRRSNADSKDIQLPEPIRREVTPLFEPDINFLRALFE
jgi:hypothetical protein